MITRVEKYIRQFHMWTQGDHVVAGISGGADSICLLLMLLDMKERWNLSITAVHVNHGLRGSDSDSDEAFVKKICQQYQVPCRSFHVNAKLEAQKRKVSEEEAGRDLRREIFETVRREAGAQVIALAHHENDNVETFLFRLCRGSGLEGLCGIKPVSGKIVHPLLCVNRSEIEAYLQERNQYYCTDHTNFENDYSRNKIRNQLLPFLENEINPASAGHISNTMKQFLEIQEYLSDQLVKMKKDCVLEKGDSVCVLEQKLCCYPKILQEMLLKDCLIQVAGHQRDIGSTHVEALQELMALQCGRERHLPYHVLATRDYEGISLRKMEEISESGHADCIVKSLEVPCNLGWIQAEKFLKPEKYQIFEKTFTKCFDYDIIKSTLQIRTRREGDYLIVDRAGNRQKLKSYFINQKIPKEKRNQILLLADGNHILWVIGYRMSMGAQVTENTKTILKVIYTEEKEHGRDS